MLDESGWVERRLTVQGLEMIIGDVLVEVVMKEVNPGSCCCYNFDVMIASGEQHHESHSQVCA